MPAGLRQRPHGRAADQEKFGRCRQGCAKDRTAELQTRRSLGDAGELQAEAEEVGEVGSRQGRSARENGLNSLFYFTTFFLFIHKKHYNIYIITTHNSHLTLISALFTPISIDFYFNSLHLPFITNSFNQIIIKISPFMP